MQMQRRQILTWLPAFGGGAACGQESRVPRMRPLAADQRASVTVGAGTQAGVTTGSSGPQKEGDREGAAAGSLGSTQPGGAGSGGGPSPSPGGGSGRAGKGPSR